MNGKEENMCGLTGVHFGRKILSESLPHIINIIICDRHLVRYAREDSGGRGTVQNWMSFTKNQT